MDDDDIVDLMGALGPDAEALGKPVAIWTMGVAGGMAPLDPPIVGRVSGFEGTVLGGCHSIILIASPHGSTFRSGRCYVRPANAADLARLAALDADAAQQAHTCSPTEGGA